MYKQRISYADYVEEVERLYKIERREIYFGFVIRDFIQSILTESEQLEQFGITKDTRMIPKIHFISVKIMRIHIACRILLSFRNNIAIRILQNHMFRLS